MTFGMEKLEWCGYPTLKNFLRYDYSFWHNSRTWQTDRRTLHGGIGHACIASLSKKTAQPSKAGAYKLCPRWLTRL